MDEKVSFSERLQYEVDNLFSRGTGVMLGVLGILTLVIILLATLIITVGKITQEGGDPLNFAEAFWQSMMRALDSGAVGAHQGWVFRLVMLMVTIGGIFVLSILIGTLTSGIEGKLEELRKGRSRVLESKHTIILGWTEEIFTVISELVIANENQPKPCIVIMGDKDKVEMEDEIRDKVGNTGRTKIVCRRGNPIQMSDLELVNTNLARSIIILSPESNDPDAQVIKIALAIVNHPARRSQPYHVVAQIRDPKNMQVAIIVGKGEVEWVQVGGVVARLIAQTCRQSGLSVVYTELLDFSGDEIYLTHQSALEGKPYSEALLSFEKSTVMGVKPKNGVPRLNPAMDTILSDGDELVLLAEDDDKIFCQKPENSQIKESAIITGAMAHLSEPEQTLILGWNWRGAAIIKELDNYVADGSEVVIVAEKDDVEEQIKWHCASLKQKITFTEGNITDRQLLESLGLEKFEHIILLSYDEMAVQEADAHTLVTLLHLRDYADKHKCHFSITSEMRDTLNRKLADVTRADDFVVSDKLISLMMAQVSENKSLNAVFEDIFDPEGAEIYLKNIQNYVSLNTPVNFYTVVKAASKRGETAIGYRQVANAKNAEKQYGIVLNPAKKEEIIFKEGDLLIVLADS